MKTPARVAIVGRPNVGKSTLFNRIVGRRRALVHPQPGVTRDIQRAEAEWNGVVFEIIDTGGLFSGVEDGLAQEVEKRALREALSAEAMIFVTDATNGVTAGDEEVAKELRSATAPVLLAVNKTEKRSSKHAAGEFFQLGFAKVFSISALHGEGIGDLLDALVSGLPRRRPAPPDQDLRLAVVGRPNVGKSSIVNRIIGSDANIVDSRPGTTRDCIDTVVRWQGRQVVLVDTAGIKRRSRTKDGLTALTALKSIDAISRAEVVVMVLDASRDVAMQDVKVASYAHKAARGIMFCVNKWDLLDKDNTTAPQFEKKIRRSFAFLKYAPILFTSALEGQRISRIFPLAWRIKESREKRISTSEINKFIEETVQRTPPPSHRGGNGKIYFATQAEVAPPTFLLSVNRRAFFGRSYLRFLNNRIREKYGFEGTLIRLRLKEH
ncbi:MAG: ribosome biogenesis GTPase Der [Candidatus Latescibacterota bacterium]|nr:MAG: ribosome biogenesis GTPase Der [Candidatus Latescibacterota bacterium]